ncbi:MAG: glycine cleavage system protein GcvH [Gemmatimonadetes bacterium]|nr:glycine cleavage system protein GcvH [Gemmatimonadota bacterium]
MSEIPQDLRYTEEHEYVRTEGDAVVTIGITHYAQGELGDVVYVDLPEVGTQVDRMDVFGTIEAVKAVSELFSPLGGEVVEVNSALDGDPSLVNKNPYDDGWMIKIQMRDAAELDGLLSPSDYAQHIGE